jgi:hypothetical protein
MKTPDTPPTPIDVPSDDPTGSDTERNYRYQHAYGAILLIGAAFKKLPYVAVYVEHHEDLLCERSDSRVDGYQIKTRNPEEGDWDLSDEAIKKSIKRFVELNKAFPEYICSLKLVSNVNFSNPGSDIKDQSKLRRSPIKFLEAEQKCSRFDEIAAPFDETFRGLQEYCGCSSEELFLTLQKVELLKGPERTSFDSEIVTTHLATLPVCSSYTVPVLNAIREELIHKVYIASHVVDDPSKHWIPINRISSDNPYITSRRLPVEVVLQVIQDKADPPFRYYDAPTIALGNGRGNLAILKKKMERGDLHSQILTMERRSLSAEQNLIEYAIRYPIETDGHLAQLESIVQGECDEAYLHASLSEKPFGRQMLDDVYARLKLKANEHDLVLRQPYELLVGIAGLLTGECKVWWSERFDLEGEE